MTNAGEAPERFPIITGGSIAWSRIAPHEEQAKRNHGQSLAHLAERGGLDPLEAWAVLNDRSWRQSECTPSGMARAAWEVFGPEVVAAHNTDTREAQHLFDERWTLGQCVYPGCQHPDSPDDHPIHGDSSNKVEDHGWRGKTVLRRNEALEVAVEALERIEGQVATPMSTDEYIKHLAQDALAAIAAIQEKS